TVLLERCIRINIIQKHHILTRIQTGFAAIVPIALDQSPTRFRNRKPVGFLKFLDTVESVQFKRKLTTHLLRCAELIHVFTVGYGSFDWYIRSEERRVGKGYASRRL